MTEQGMAEQAKRGRGRTVARRWWPLAAAVPLGAVVGAGYAVLAPAVYTANSYVVVVPTNGGEAGLAVNFAQAYGRLAAQPQVLAMAAPDAGRTGAELANQVAGTTSPDAPVIEIAGSGGQPDAAVKAADAVAKALVSFANTSSKETGVKLVPLAAAADPDKPTTPSKQLDVAVGGAAGVLVGALAMMARRKGTGDADAAPVPTGGPAVVGPAAGPVAAVPTPSREKPESVGSPK
ncbi:Wzz/FepE/Etk N-terminal domain-containing protein [Kitasatospora kifunensis]|uniref:Capsular polysaccharide biosynthesis protein n=1 Tax=Kitasatospora kifunensis TaxID=58351 RepID=A0A7W7R5Z9_KITKI|nr:Wzz/FepE/Etk N-terminal domain-containing protein [Kitasatospora kifunensis]MBB4925986.1 capsular polysaccharide biosynthesis protein [Kitasatospora kifunensis]